MGTLAAVFLLGAGLQAPRNAPSGPFGMTEVLEKHAEWLASNGSRGAKADFRDLSLDGSDLHQTEFLVGRTVLNDVDLRQADFRTARLRNVDFTAANLQDARFDQANLRWAILANANLRRANFTGANMQSVDLRGADLDQAKLERADLSGADLSSAKCVIKSQLAVATVDEQTKLPIFEDCSGQRE